MGKIIKIQNAEQLDKYVGRCVQARILPGYVFAQGTLSRSGSIYWVNDNLLGSANAVRYADLGIELLDGPDHPPPAAGGWRWVQTNGEAKDMFDGKRVDIDAPGVCVYGPCRKEHRASVGVVGGTAAEELGFSPLVRRILPAAPDPREVISAEIERTEARISALQDSLERLEREAEAREWPLPEGWCWSDDDDAVATDGGTSVWAGYYEGVLQVEFSTGRDCAPLAVVKAVIARYEAEHADEAE